MTAARLQTQATAPVSALLTRLPTGLDALLPTDPITYWADGLLEATVLASHIFDIRRRRPLVVTTPNRFGRYSTDPDTLAAALWSTADVVAISNHETVLATCASLPTWLAVHDGGTRLYAPGADIADDSHRHPLFPYDRNPSKILERAASSARHIARHRHHDPAVALETERQAHEVTRQDLGRVRVELSSLRSTMDKEGDDRAVFSDPAIQFEHELHLAWLHAVPESDRDTWDLSRDFVLGPHFLDSVEQIQTISRHRIIRACVDVITGRYPEIPGREAKLLLDGTPTTGKGRPAIVRTTDKAKAWRCAVQARGAGAVRLMWWELPDGSAELSRVAEHDDARIL